jgi:hypothetical protein
MILTIEDSHLSSVTCSRLNITWHERECKKIDAALKLSGNDIYRYRIHLSVDEHHLREGNQIITWRGSASHGQPKMQP